MSFESFCIGFVLFFRSDDEDELYVVVTHITLEGIDVEPFCCDFIEGHWV
jgi:hypothetical protein